MDNCNKKETFEEVFKTFSKFGDTKSTGTYITLSQSDKWMKQTKIIDGKKLTTTDTAICFKKFKALKININDYKKFINDLAKTKNLNADDIFDKMTKCGQPRLSNVVLPKRTPTIERLTDVNKYTGTHKERFDESGKGKGIEGREDVVDNSGYVNGFKTNDSINKK